jgi:hypothetical protein
MGALCRVLAVGLCAFSIGCQTARTPRPAEVRLRNDTVEVVFATATARIVRYGFVGGGNLLWTLADAKPYAAATGTWNNWGGDKAWIWPQDDWGPVTGKGWPPPPEAETVERLERPTPLSLRTVSPVVPAYNVRVVRDIRLADTGTELTVTSRLVPEDGVAGTDRPFAVWVVAQVGARADGIYVRAVTNDVRWFRFKGGEALANPVPVAGTRVLRLDRDPTQGGKVGLDGDAFGVRYGDTLFVQKASPFAVGGRFDPGARLQLYATPDVSPQFPPAAGPYAELELTAPLLPRDRVADGPLTVVWSLHRLPSNAGDADVAAILGRE